MNFRLLFAFALSLPLALQPARLASAHEFTAPEHLVANPDGSFSFSAVFTTGPGIGYFNWDFVDCSTNVSGNRCWMTGDGFCLHPMEEGYTVTYEIEGQLLDRIRPGRITIYFSTECPEDADPRVHRVTTTILPHAYLESPAVLTLQADRFAAVVEWRDASHNSGWAETAPCQTDETGLFWFFNPDNWEVMVKVLDGCDLDAHFWVFSAATTNVEYMLSVTDTATGSVRRYHNPLNTAAPAVTDTMAFPACP
jgi:hypothetical protein